MPLQNRDSGGQPLVSIIIPHWNGIKVLEECLNSLKKTTYPNLEIIVVDNASTDGSPEWVEKNYPDIKLVRNSENKGYAGGCNRGAENASGDFLLFLNNDTVHEKDWIEPLVETMTSDEQTGAVQPKILNYFHRNTFDYAGGAGGEMDILVFPFARGRIFLTMEKDEGQYDDTVKIFWASGTAFMVKKDLFINAGKFDEMFFAHQEEIDLQWRLQLMGYRIEAIPASVVYHKNAVTLPMHSFRKNYLNHRNSLFMLLTNYSLPMAVYLFPLRFALELVAVVYASVLLDFKHLGAIFKSLFWILVHPVAIVRKRKAVKRLRKIRDREMVNNFYKGSVVMDYYIRKKKIYSDLGIPR